MGVTANYSLRYEELTDTPDGATGLKNLANDVDAALHTALADISVKPAFTRKTADEARSGTTALADDGPTGGSLKITGLVTGGIYDVAAVLRYDGGTGGSETDFKWKFTTPGSSTGFYFWDGLTVGTPVPFQASGWGDTNKAQSLGIGNPFAVMLRGLLIAGAAGTLQLQWAPNVANATNTHLMLNSYLTARKAG